VWVGGARQFAFYMTAFCFWPTPWCWPTPSRWIQCLRTTALAMACRERNAWSTPPAVDPSSSATRLSDQLVGTAPDWLQVQWPARLSLKLILSFPVDVKFSPERVIVTNWARLSY
jgi:hypothetical protein